MSLALNSRLLVTIETDPGKTQKPMEDSNVYFVAPAAAPLREQIAVAVVADGISEQMGGQEASRIVIDTIKQYFLSNSTTDPSKAISSSIESAHNAILERKRAKPELADMGSTVTVAVIALDREFTDVVELFVGNVGDSRAYFIRAGDAQQITTDHTSIQDASDAGQTNRKAPVHPNRHVLTQYLGMSGTVTPDISPRELLWPGDTVLLCTDGLTDLVEDNELKKIIDPKTPNTAAHRLVSLALKRGGYDNITAMTIELLGPLGTRVAAPVISRPIPTRSFVVAPVFLASILVLLAVGAWIFKTVDPFSPASSTEQIAIVRRTPTAKMIAVTSTPTATATRTGRTSTPRTVTATPAPTDTLTPTVSSSPTEATGAPPTKRPTVTLRYPAVRLREPQNEQKVMGEVAVFEWQDAGMQQAGDTYELWLKRYGSPTWEKSFQGTGGKFALNIRDAMGYSDYIWSVFVRDAQRQIVSQSEERKITWQSKTGSSQPSDPGSPPGPFIK